jgi:hypothetical protein
MYNVVLQENTMYYVFETDLQYWRGGLIRAIPKVGYLDFKPHWWSKSPLLQPIPNLTFEVNSNAPLVDNLFVGVHFSIFSEKLVNILKTNFIKFELFPCILQDKKSKKEVSVSYQACHLLEVYPGVDTEQSVIDQENYTVTKLVLSEATYSTQRLFFRLEESMDLVVIHETMKAELEREKITGCRYTPIEEFQIGFAPKFVK